MERKDGGIRAISPEAYSAVARYLKLRFLPEAPEGRSLKNQLFDGKRRADCSQAALSSAVTREEASAEALSQAPRPAGDALDSLEEALSQRLRRADESFTQSLLRILREKDLTEPEVYNRIFMDRKLFNKIRNNPAYQPSKRTAIQLALGLRLNLDETRDFIGKAGFALTRSSRFDIIIEYFLLHGNYDVLEINDTLYAFGEPLLVK